MEMLGVVDPEGFEPAVLVTYDEFDPPVEPLSALMTDLDLLAAIEADASRALFALGRPG